MRGKGLAAGRNGPHMNIVDEGYALDLFHFMAQLVWVYMLGGPFKEHVHDREHQVPTAPEDEQGDDDAQDRVGEIPLQRQDEHRGDYDSNRTHQVG